MSRVVGRRARFLASAVPGGRRLPAAPAVPRACPCRGSWPPPRSCPAWATVRVWGDAPFSHALLQAELPHLKSQVRGARQERRPQAGLEFAGASPAGPTTARSAPACSSAGPSTADRPEFDLVTGISAGALIAPFAFLGRDYDRQLAGLFTSYGADQIYQSNVLSGLFGGSALADSAPLAQLIEHYVDAPFLRRVAEERRKGRFLLIGTTNLDAQRPVYWDMGRIAQSSDPSAPELFRRVLLASASFPGIFPPVHIKVQAGGHRYEEMHVDGGTTREVFFTIADFRFKRYRSGDRPQGSAQALDHPQRQDRARVQGDAGFDLRHCPALAGDAGQEPRCRRPHRACTAGRAPTASITTWRRSRCDFEAPHPKPFDRAYMQALYEVGLVAWAVTDIPGPRRRRRRSSKRGVNSGGVPIRGPPHPASAGRTHSGIRDEIEQQRAQAKGAPLTRGVRQGNGDEPPSSVAPGAEILAPALRARSPWCCRAAARSAPIRPASTRPWRSGAICRTGSPASRSARSTAPSSPAIRPSAGSSGCANFWELITDGIAGKPLLEGDFARGIFNEWSALASITSGVEGFYQSAHAAGLAAALGYGGRAQLLRHGAAAGHALAAHRFRAAQLARRALQCRRGQHPQRQLGLLRQRRAPHRAGAHHGERGPAAGLSARRDRR